MAISKEQARELASELPDNLCCGTARERLVCIAEILRTLSDEEHPLSNADIRTILGAYFGKGFRAPAENTLGDDLRSLCKTGCLDFEVEQTTRGVYAKNLRFEVADVRLMLNAVQSSQFLTYGQSSNLQEKILSLVSRYREWDLQREVYVKRRTSKREQDVFDTCDVITRAMHDGHKIEFSYVYVDFNDKPHPLLSDEDAPRRVETPIGIIFSEGNYYLESYADPAWRHGRNIMRSRVDRMLDAVVSDEPADDTDEVRQARKTLKKRVDESTNMMEGTSRVVFLRVRSDRINIMLDRFGYGLNYHDIQGTLGDPAAAGLTCVRVAQSSTFYRWLTSSGDGIVIEKPPMDMTLSLRRWKQVINGKKYEELLADYDTMVNGYIDFLKRALAPYASGDGE